MQEAAEGEGTAARPEADQDQRDGKPKGFFYLYLDHRTVDAAHAIITDTFATPANLHDSIVYLGRLDRQVERFVSASPPPASPGDWRSAPSGASPATATRRRPSPA